MHGKILDMNKTDAFISFDNGTTMDICMSHIPSNSKVGDKVTIDLSNISNDLSNDKMNNFLL